MRQTVLSRVISARLHSKGQPLYGCLCIILHNGIWKTVKRKINSQINIRLILKINDKFNKYQSIQIFWISEIGTIDFKASETDFFWMRPMSGCTTALVICCIMSIISFNAMRMWAVKSLVSFVLNQGLWVKINIPYTWRLNRVFLVLISDKAIARENLSCGFLTE